jgi:hypothetical protein
MEQVRMQPLPIEERDKIHRDIEENYQSKRLMDDPNSWRVAGQEVFLFSCLSPWSEVENAEMQDVHEFLNKIRISKINQRKLIKLMYEKMLIQIKFRGAFESEDKANEHLSQNIGYGDGIQCYIAKSYRYGTFPPDIHAKKENMTVNYQDDRAQKYYDEQRKRIEEESRTFEKRRQLFKKASSDNCRRWEKLTDVEKKKEIDKEDQEKYHVEGVHVDKIFKHRTIMKMLTTEILNAINSIAIEAELPVEMLVGAWDKVMKKGEKQEVVGEEGGESSSSAAAAAAAG